MRFKAVILVIISIAFMGLSTPDKVTGVVNFSQRGVNLLNADTTYIGNKKYFRVSDTTYESNRNPYITDLILSFNSSANYLFRDDTGRYKVGFADYKHIKKSGAVGGGAAFFYKQNHCIMVTNQHKMWLSNSKDLGSFSIEMRIHPVLIKDRSIIFSRVGYSSGIKNGIEISIEKGKLNANFYSLFVDANGRRKSSTLVSLNRLEEKKWYHYTISYDRITGKLSHYIDGEEEDVLYMTSSGKNNDNVMKPSFAQNMPSLIMGKNYYGYIDELRLSFRSFDRLKKRSDLSLTRYRGVELKGNMPVNKEGVITSPVYEFKSSGTMITDFSWKEKLKKDTHTWMEFRISDSKFEKGDRFIPWYRIKNNQKNIYLKKVNNNFLRGKYYQWRAHLIVSPDGKRSPLMGDIKLDYQLDPSPAVPLFLESVKKGSGFITLRWKKNVDHDFLGYKIYYGIKSGNYEGVLRIKNGKRITNSHNTGDFIEIKIDNKLIKENKKNNRSGMLAFPEIKNNILYYFTVSAYDSYRPGSPHNHESGLSVETSARPVAGSEIK